MRVIATADTFCKAMYDTATLTPDIININKEMLDDSNAAKEQMDMVKKRLQKILNPEHPEKCPPEFVMPDGMTDLAMPVHNLIVLLEKMRLLMSDNLKGAKTFKWCTPESPFLFEVINFFIKERWEKLFHDFCDVERSQFEPSKISELYDSLKFDLLHNRKFIDHAFSSGKNDDYVHELYFKTKEIFDIIGPHEYGIENQEKLLIGFRNTSHLIKKLISDLENAKDSPNPCTRLYFTKESKVYCLLNALLLCGIKVKIIPTDVPELDYLTQIIIELYERNTMSNDPKNREYSLRIELSHGAHDPNLIDLALTSDHSLSVASRK